MEYLSNKSFLTDELLDMEPDEQRRINHTECVAGEDTKRRLYVKRPADKPDILIGYCHNCGLHGIYKAHLKHPPKIGLAGAALDTKYPNRTEELIKEDQCITDWTDWPEKAQLFIIHKAPALFTETTKDKRDDYINRYLWYDDINEQIVINYFEGTGSAPLSQQTRSIYPKKVRYKTINSPDNSTTKVTSTIPQRNDGNAPLVIVEDMLSALTIALNGCYAYPLRGTNWDILHLRDEILENDISLVVVWLDNDSLIVRAKARQLVEELEAVTETKVILCEYKNDPKYSSDVDIILNKAIMYG